MIVLLDLEWIEKNERHLTQLSAVRVDENWDPVDSLEIFVKPDSICFDNPKHVAFGGIEAVLYENALPESDCMLTFLEWLEPEDELWVWAKSNALFLLELWRKAFPDKDTPAVRITADKVRTLAAQEYYPLQSPYTLLARYGIQPSYPEHRASNDTEVMRRLFLSLGLAPDIFADTAPKLPVLKVPASKCCQRDANRQMIEKTGYNFVYLRTSPVFHRRDCKVCLAARSEADILGSVYYETAAKERRPCRLCHPVPLVSREEYERQKQRKTQRDTFSKKVVDVKLITGETVTIKPNRVCGWCHYRLHRGALTRALLKEHECLGKNCRHLERNAQCPYWGELEKKKQAKSEKKTQQKAEEERLQLLLENWQACLDEMNLDMFIVRVAKDTPSVYRIFYVSDNRFADGNRYPDFLASLRALHPSYRINLRHIRDVDGHFVTTDEYLARRRV